MEEQSHVIPQGGPDIDAAIAWALAYCDIVLDEALDNLVVDLSYTNGTATLTMTQGSTTKTINIPMASSSVPGFMSSSDKDKLDSWSTANTVPVIDIEDIDDLKGADQQLATTPTRYAVKAVTSRGTIVVGLLDILSDSMRHLVTQVLTTHYLLDSDGALDTDAHMDTEVYQYYRSAKVVGGTLPVEPGEWTAWKHIVPQMVTLTQEAYDALVDEGKVDENVYYHTYE